MTSSRSSRFEQALVFAARLHADQVREGTAIPYVAHLLGVASIALEHGATEEEAIAALLHDAVEKRGGTAALEEIRRQFGDTITEIVRGCSDSLDIPKPPWLERKRTYLAYLRGVSPSVRLVVASDKLHNARAILRDYHVMGETIWRRFSAGRDEVLWYHRSLVDVFRSAGPSPLAEELDRVVSELETLVDRERGRPLQGKR